MSRRSVYIPEPLWSRVQAEAKADGRSASNVVCRALEKSLPKQGGDAKKGKR